MHQVQHLSQDIRSESWRASRPRTVWIAALMLLIQSIVLVVVGGLVTFDRLSILEPSLIFSWDLLWYENVGLALYGTLTAVSLFATISFLTLIAAAWNAAMLTQGLLLTAALIEYYYGQGTYVFGAMLVGIFYVLYLSNAELRLAFIDRSQRELNQAEDELLLEDDAPEVSLNERGDDA